MAWVAVDKDGSEWIFNFIPVRSNTVWRGYDSEDCLFNLPKGTIKKIIGRDLTWNDEPVELKEE